MSTPNPYENDPERAPVWLDGYSAGFNDPENDHFAPYSPELTDVYAEGVLAGRDDARYTSSDPAREDPLLGGSSSAPEGGDDSGDIEHAVEEVTLTAALHAIGEMIARAPGGLAALIFEVVEIPGCDQLRPMEADWEAPADREGDVYVAVCQAQHGMVYENVSRDGYWFGSPRSRYDDALYDVRNHEHAGAVVVLCSAVDGVCGPVVPE